jgi:hypothetical protein
VLDLGEKREGPENPYGVVDGSYANFEESPECELRLNGVLRSSLPRGLVTFAVTLRRRWCCRVVS